MSAHVRELRPSPTTPQVLIVDGEPTRRAALCRMVRGMGYRVHAAADGSEALLHLREQPGSIRLILAELELSAMTAEELAERAGRVDQSVGVVLLQAAGPADGRPSLPALLTPVSFGPLYDLLVERLGPPGSGARSPTARDAQRREPAPRRP